MFFYAPFFAIFPGESRFFYLYYLTSSVIYCFFLPEGDLYGVRRTFCNEKWMIMGREGVRTHPCGMDVLQGVHFSVLSCRVLSRRVVLRCVASRRVRRCSLREPPAAKHGSTSLRLSGRAGGFRWVFFSVLFCPVASRCVTSCPVALRCVVSAGVPFGSHLRLSMVQPL